MVNLDQDGYSDVISGSWPGELYFFRRQSDGTFAAGEKLKDPSGTPINFGSASTVFAVDWDDDGDLDLLLGNINGGVGLAINQSGAADPVFDIPVELLSLERDGKPVGDSHPVAADWDGDGKLDLVVGHDDGGAVWFRNEGTRDRPQWSSSADLILPSPSPWRSDTDRGENDWGVRAKISVTDYNGDGLLDILLGDYCGGFSEKPGQTPDELQQEREALSLLPQVRKDWAATFARYRTLLADKSDPNGEDRESRLAQLRGELTFLKDEIARCQKVQLEFQPQRQAHGYVWLFLRKRG